MKQLYGYKPVDLGLVGENIDCDEMMFYMYFPIKKARDEQVYIEQRLAKYLPLLEMVKEHCGDIMWKRSNVYITAKTIYVNKNSMGQRMGWHCFSEDTEVLTDEGWKLFPELKGTENVLTLDRTNDKSRWNIISDVLSFDYDGYLNTHEGRRVNFSITDNHRLYAGSWDRKKSTTKGFELTEYKDLPSRFYIKGRTSWVGDNPDIKEFKKGNTSSKDYVFDFHDWAEFLGWYISEGSCYTDKNSTNNGKICISQMKEDNRTKIEELMKRMGFTVHREKSMITTHSVVIAQWLKTNCGEYSHNKRVPREIKDSKVSVMNRYLEAHRLGDGTYHGKGVRYYTASHYLADDLQEMLCKLGRAKSLSLGHKKGSVANFGNKQSLRNHNVYVVSESECCDTRVNKRDVKKEYYKGKVWCIKTPDQVFMTRRKGKPMWSGNSDGFMTHDLNFIWYTDVPTEFMVLSNPVALTQDHEKSMWEMNGLALTKPKIHTYKNRHLLCMDESVIHRTCPDSNFEGVRTFVKISVSDKEYNLKGNSINPLIPIAGGYVERSEKRNCPQGSS